MQSVPKLDLAPRLNSPLSLWNPLDYLRLLYWVFFFPQAMRWYDGTFGTEQYTGNGSRALYTVLRRDSTKRNVMLQGFILLVGPLVIGGVLVQVLGLPWGWFGMAIGAGAGVTAGVGAVTAGGAAVGVAVGVAGGVAGGLAGGLAMGVAGG